MTKRAQRYSTVQAWLAGMGIKKSFLARQAGITQFAFSRYLHGHSEVPVHVAAALSALTGVPMRNVLGMAQFSKKRTTANLAPREAPNA